MSTCFSPSFVFQPYHLEPTHRGHCSTSQVRSTVASSELMNVVASQQNKQLIDGSRICFRKTLCCQKSWAFSLSVFPWASTYMRGTYRLYNVRTTFPWNSPIVAYMHSCTHCTVILQPTYTTPFRINIGPLLSYFICFFFYMAGKRRSVFPMILTSISSEKTVDFLGHIE